MIPADDRVSMIRFLSIQNLAVVEKLELELEPGLTVFTGETGAGKSIVLGALGLLIGNRATSDLLRTGATKAKVEATVDTEGDREIILRREITVQGRSRAFIDDTLATVTALQSLGQQLIDLHGQHEHQSLLDPLNHLSLLDTFGELADISANVVDGFRTWRMAHTALDRLRLSARDKVERSELLTLQQDEIDRVAPGSGEDDALSKTRMRLANADRLAGLCGVAYAALYERDDAVLATLGQIWRQIDELASLDPAFAEHTTTRDVVQPHLEELAFFLRSYAAGIDSSPDRLGEVEARLADVERLKRKYGPGLKDVLTYRDRLETELTELEEGPERLAKLTKTEAAARQGFVNLAKQLSTRRRRAAKMLSQELLPILADLAIPAARFEMHFEAGPLSEAQWSESGIDVGEFYFSANPGETLRPLARVASGGELSRVMLGLKTLASTDAPGKTLVFDEVDAGIGGAAADRVGRRLRELGEKFQILCVTHLPQIAAYATTHHHVSKVVRDDRTVTQIEQLTEQGRVSEIARLMAGDATKEAKESARALLSSKQNTKGENERAKAKGQ